MAKRRKPSRRADDSGVEEERRPATQEESIPVTMATEHVNEWTSLDVANWLRNVGFPEYINSFCDLHRITGKALLTLTESDLRQPPLEMNILGDIKTIIVEIHRLRLLNRGRDKCIDDVADSGEGNHRHYHYAETMRRTPPIGVSDDYDDDYIPEQEHASHHHHPKYSTRLEPEYFKLFISYLYMMLVFWCSSFTMVVVHSRVPDMQKYPPLPDLFLDNMPYVPWAFDMCELTALGLALITTVMLFFHKHRFIIMRRLFAMTGTVFMLRCITMFITSLSVPGTHLECRPKTYDNLGEKLKRAFEIWQGFGMSLQGVRTCGDYMFSGHTVIVTMLNFFNTEYIPRRWHYIHSASWVMNMFSIFFILAAHEHYSIDVFIAFYITSRLFLYYHSLANAAPTFDYKTRIWFPMYSYFESSVDGAVPNCYEWPFVWPKWAKISV